MIRAIVVLALIAAPVFLSSKLVPHHEGSGSVFIQLYSHVLPHALETGGHGHDAHGSEAHGNESHGDDSHGDEHAHHGSNPENVITAPIPLPEAFRYYTGEHKVESGVPIFNLQLFQVFDVLILLVCFQGVPACIRTGKGDVITRLFAGFAMWVRDEMVAPIMGKDGGNAFLPFFLAIFFFILFMNLLGLVPGGATATASPGVTLALASVTFIAMIAMGMKHNGAVKFWTGLVPHGLPLPLWPLMFLIEVVGLVVKPVALTIRLFANMTAGHLIVLSGMGLIYYFGETSDLLGWVASPLAVGFAVFIMIIESFVAMLQAYIFTYLSILFIQMCVHPEH